MNSVVRNVLKFCKESNCVVTKQASRILISKRRSKIFRLRWSSMRLSSLPSNQIKNNSRKKSAIWKNQGTRVMTNLGSSSKVLWVRSNPCKNSSRSAKVTWVDISRKVRSRNLQSSSKVSRSIRSSKSWKRRQMNRKSSFTNSKRRNNHIRKN